MRDVLLCIHIRAPIPIPITSMWASHAREAIKGLPAAMATVAQIRTGLQRLPVVVLGISTPGEIVPFNRSRENCYRVQGHSEGKTRAPALGVNARQWVPGEGTQRIEGHGAADAGTGQALQDGVLLTLGPCVDNMSTHENHQADTHQRILDAIPSGQTIAGTMADANEGRTLVKHRRPPPDLYQR